MSDALAYDLSKSERDLQRYFIYEAVEKDGQTELKDSFENAIKIALEIMEEQ
jgi:hypothetical protein